MARLSRGDIEALGELYARHVSLVKSAVYKFGRDLPRARCDEIVQDVFIVLHKTARRYTGGQKFKTWLWAIAIRTARHRRRNMWLRRRLLGERSGASTGLAWRKDDSPESLTDLREQACRALESLPQGQLDVVLLHAEGFTGEEIAELLSLRPKTVWTRLHRARRTLWERSEAEAASAVAAEVKNEPL